MLHRSRVTLLVALCWSFAVPMAFSQAQAAKPPQPSTKKSPAQSSKAAPPPSPTQGVATPPDYVIGPEDQLSVVFWRERDLSGDVVVRPDGKISLPLLNDVQAAGLTPDQLRQTVADGAAKFVEDTTVTVVVRQINSRRVFITGQVARPGSYSLTSTMNILQLIALAGGLNEYADSKNITIMRNESGKLTPYSFNYNEVVKRKNLKQNIDLRPGDTVIVP